MSISGRKKRLCKVRSPEIFWENFTQFGCLKHRVVAGVTVDEDANIARGQIMKGLYFMPTTRQMAQERYEKKPLQRHSLGMKWRR